MEEEKRKVRQVASGKIRKKTLAEKAGDAFFSEDTRTVKEYLFWEVLIPTLKNGIADLFIGGIEMALFGSTRGSRSSSRGGDKHVNYSSFSRDDRRSSVSRRVDRSSRDDRYDYSNIILDSRAEAEEVILNMEELVSKYGDATVADLNSLVGITGKHTDNKWGWTDSRDFHLSRSGRGYILDFNPPVYLD